ncbi:MAG: hypothetical protein AVDCRST_MAG47-157, partial [uncultured Nocardioidaceae bacterium]
ADPPVGRGRPRALARAADRAHLRADRDRRPGRRLPGRRTDALHLRRGPDRPAAPRAAEPRLEGARGGSRGRPDRGPGLRLRGGGVERRRGDATRARGADQLLHRRAASRPGRRRRRPGGQGGDPPRPALPHGAARLGAPAADRRRAGRPAAPRDPGHPGRRPRGAGEDEVRRQPERRAPTRRRHPAPGARPRARPVRGRPGGRVAGPAGHGAGLARRRPAV